MTVITFDFDNTIIKSFENDQDGTNINYQFGGLNKEIIKRIKETNDCFGKVIKCNWIS